MTSKQRVSAALNRRPTDRIPIFMWFQPSTARRLAEVLDIPPQHVAEAMGNDIRQAWVNNNYAMEGIVHDQEGASHTDAWGILWRKRGEFNQPEVFPLFQAPPQAMLDYEFPHDHKEFLLGQMEPLQPYRDEFFVGVDVSPCAFEMFWRLRGMDCALEDMAGAADIANTLLSRCADFAVDLSETACQRYPVDWLWTGDDVAGQDRLLMSPELWRELVKPHLQRVINVGLERGLPVAYHCCGAIRSIVPELIEMGIDVLNPVQVTCPGMDAAELKQEFGAYITFMGGVDTQHLLPHGTPDQVYGATLNLIQTMTSDGGGFILAATHTIPPETPLENIFAMYQAAGLSREQISDQAAAIRQRN
jgi:uroporphyrinogen decarboxylase